jgi:hypothetical protein
MRYKCYEKSSELTLLGSFLKVKRQFSGFGGFGGGAKSNTAVLSKSHKSNLTIANPTQADWVLLGGNRSVVMSPEVMEGPFCKHFKRNSEQA